LNESPTIKLLVLIDKIELVELRFPATTVKYLLLYSSLNYLLEI